MNAKKRRALIIRRLVREHRIASQEELLSLLEREGVDCTQATLSRHLRELGISRHATEEGPVYRASRERTWLEAMREVVGAEVHSIQHNDHLVVLRTLPGRASGVAAFIDRLERPEILGTIAGDDTLFVAPAADTPAAGLAQLIRDEIAQENT